MGTSTDEPGIGVGLLTSSVSLLAVEEAICLNND
jgi:hypothetical protein